MRKYLTNVTVKTIRNGLYEFINVSSDKLEICFADKFTLTRNEFIEVVTNLEFIPETVQTMIDDFKDKNILCMSLTSENITIIGVESNIIDITIAKEELIRLFDILIKFNQGVVG